jgi:small-conductance mechanosensitive channel
MQFENWFAIGDSVIIEPSGLGGIVEETSLRSTKLRSVGGDVIHVNNSAISAIRVLPRGIRELTIELVVRDEKEGRRVFEDAARVMPIGATQFVRAPRIESVERLAEGFLTDVLRERAAAGLIVHGPVVIAVDELARLRYARATSGAERG